MLLPGRKTAPWCSMTCSLRTSTLLPFAEQASSHAASRASCGCKVKNHRGHLVSHLVVCPHTCESTDEKRRMSGDRFDFDECSKDCHISSLMIVHEESGTRHEIDVPGSSKKCSECNKTLFTWGARPQEPDQIPLICRSRPDRVESNIQGSHKQGY